MQTKIKVTGELSMNGRCRPFTKFVWVDAGNNARRDARRKVEAFYGRLQAVSSVNCFSREYVHV